LGSQFVQFFTVLFFHQRTGVSDGVKEPFPRHRVIGGDHIFSAESTPQKKKRQKEFVHKSSPLLLSRQKFSGNVVKNAAETCQTLLK
jgi:hypothetical protein